MANNASCFQAVHTLNDIGIESKWSKTTPFWPTDIFIQGLWPWSPDAHLFQRLWDIRADFPKAAAPPSERPADWKPDHRI